MYFSSLSMPISIRTIEEKCAINDSLPLKVTGPRAAGKTMHFSRWRRRSLGVAAWASACPAIGFIDMFGIWLIFTMTALAVSAQTGAETQSGASVQNNDAFVVLTDCSGSPSEPGDVAAAIHASDRVRVRYSLGGSTLTCYAVSAAVNGQTVEGFLLGDAHPDIAAFEREARSRIPLIPEPPKPNPAAAPEAKDGKNTKEGTPASDFPKSFAGLSGTSPGGRRVSLDSISAPTVVLYFWSANNSKSVREADGMEGVYNQYRGKGVGVVGVVSGSAESVRKALRDEEVLWPQIMDNGDIAARYPASKETRYYILDRQRNTVAALKSPTEVQRALLKMRQSPRGTE
jgi:peroxiredoxin